MSGATVITGTENIKNARIFALRSMLGLELKGLGRRGRSAYSIIKAEFGFKGNKQKVYDQVSLYIEKLLSQP